MRSIDRLVCKNAAVLLVVLGCASATPETRQEMLARTRGQVEGKVVEKATGLPLSGVSASTQYLGDATDQEGRYEIVYLEPGTVRVEFERRDISKTHVTVEIVAGQTTRLDVAVEKAPPACCELEGTWSIELEVGRAPTLVEAGQRSLSGEIVFSKTTPPPLNQWRVESLDETIDEFGSFEIDFGPVFGDKYAGESPFVRFCEGTEDCVGMKEAWGYVSNRNHVEIILIPRVADYGFGLTGVIEGDQIRGTWVERAYAVTSEGGFSMKRISD